MTSYEKLSPAQKRILFNGNQLNNAYVIEMMGNGANGAKNLALRQNTAAAVVDSVKLWKPEELPFNYTRDKEEKNFWERFHKEGVSKSIVMATDDSEPMMTHFLENNMKEQHVTRGDVAFIVGDKNGWNDGDATRSYIYDSRVMQQDIVCLNGYVHVLDKVLVPPSSMAEELRKDGETQIFSHMLDRFSAPYYDATLTSNYKALYSANVDSVFEKRYFAVNTKTGRLNVGPDRVAYNDLPLLNYDPGWNSYKPAGGSLKENDMAAMFVPNDKAMRDYFVNGGGRVLIERYGVLENTDENLLVNIDQIPLKIVQPLLNNLMKASFNESVPSKYLTITNDARDPMFPLRDYPSQDAYKSIIDKTKLANNGVIYVLNRVISPADYASVLAPALYSSNTQIVSTVVRADDSFVQGSDYAKAPLQQYFSTYLKAMQSRFTFFVPTDEGLGTTGYFDPASMSKAQKLYYRWTPSTTKGAPSGVKVLAVRQTAWQWNPATGAKQGDREVTSKSSEGHSPIELLGSNGYVKKNLLIEMVNHHILVHDNDDHEGFNANRKYFISRDGAPVIVESTGARGVGTLLMGGFQEQLKGTGAAYESKITDVYDQTRESRGYGNGMTYFLDRPMQATTNTTYKVLQSKPEYYSEFLKLCEGVSSDLLDKAGLYDSLRAKKQDNDVERGKVDLKYSIFVAGQKGGQQFYVPSGDKLVRFFNNYRYTVYAPTNEAILHEINVNKLPTWESIESYLTANLKKDVALAADKSNQAEVDAIKKHNDEVKLKAQVQITLLVNFLKYHFQDQSLFVDNVNNTDKYTTSSVNNETKVYETVEVRQSNNSLTVVDKAGNAVKVMEPYNLLARDANFDSSSPLYIRSSSYAVVHTINQALHFDKSLATPGSNARKWSSVKQAKAFLSKYRIKE
ncbi:MAG: hypothetical protein D8H91_10515 [Alloprevotella sp.]|nr:MAG: hypothetical protein D8H91_10515 [Alloprevotella sp.]